MSTYIIPVVVHVIYGDENGVENISDAQILSGIETNNAQYHGDDGGPDTDIEFRLAKIDPNGDCTNGITRTLTNKPYVHILGETNTIALSDLDKCNLSRWDPDSYLNIWIVKGINDNPETSVSQYNFIRGYSNFPSQVDLLVDGVTVLYKNFGTIETAEIQNDLLGTNTETHEIGHYLNLGHPWQTHPDAQVTGLTQCENLCETLNESDCNLFGDMVCDTKPANTRIGSSYPNCENLALSCSTCPDFVDPFYIYPADNYMSKVLSCHIRFTPLQIVNMHTALEEAPNRFNLWTPANLTETGTSDALFFSGLNIQATNITPNACDGSTTSGGISLNVTGGIGPYTYDWSTGETTPSISSLSGGWYSVYVYDNSPSMLCGTQSFFVPSPSLSFDITKSCIEDDTGSVDLTVENANPVSFNWVPGGSSNEDLIGVGVGNYTVTVITDLSCEISGLASVNSWNSLNITSANVNITGTDCSDPYGSVMIESVLVSSGIIDFLEYEWTNSSGDIVSTDQDLIGFPAGNYNLELSFPPTGCSRNFSYTIPTTFPITNPFLLNVTSNMTLTGDLQFLEGIIVENGAVLTINNADIQFGPDAGITVEIGGKIIVNNNSTLTSFDCEDSWLGIEVLGTAGYHQGPNPTATSPWHGVAHIHGGSTIENAVLGITNARRNDNIGGPVYGGGKIHIVDANFTNCQEAVRLAKYINMSGNTAVPVQCNFYDVNFTWNGDFPFISYKPMMRMVKVSGVDIIGCSFENVNTGLYVGNNNSHVNAAIYMLNTSINMNHNCPLINSDGSCASTNPTPSTMVGFNYGIVNFSKIASSIRNTDFANYRSIWMIKNVGSRITENRFYNMTTNLENFADFNNPFNETWHAHYGICMEKSTRFWIEANELDFPSTNIREAGIIIRDAGSGNNRLYDNNFMNCQYAIIAYDNNRSITSSNNGLNILCNNFDNNYNDIWVDYTTPSPGTNWGISTNQGVPSESAGNQFGTVNGGYKIDNYLGFVNYYKVSSENIVPSETDGLVTLWIIPNEHGCDSNVPKSTDHKREAAVNAKNESNANRISLINLVDGGDSEELTMDVILADFTEASELYYELMSKSPNLSTKVMEEAINKEYTLPPALLTMILKSNPTAAKSGKLQTKLDNRMIPLSEYQRYMIDQGKNLISEKEYLEAELGSAMLVHQASISEGINLILFDDEIEDKESAIDAYILGLETIEHHYMKANRLMASDQHAEALITLNEIPSYFELTERQTEEWSDYLTLYNLLINFDQNNISEFSEVVLDQVEEIANKLDSEAAGMAWQMLEIHGGAYVMERLIPPGANEKSLERTGKGESINPFNDLQYISAYPNPADKMLIVEFVGYDSNLSISLLNSIGENVYLKEINGKKLQEIINTGQFSSGVYQLMLKNDKQVIHSEKIIIKR